MVQLLENKGKEGEKDRQRWQVMEKKSRFPVVQTEQSVHRISNRGIRCLRVFPTQSHPEILRLLQQHAAK